MEVDVLCRLVLCGLLVLCRLMLCGLVCVTSAV